MKTLKRGFVLRLMSVVLTLMMLFSLVSVGIVSTAAAEVDLAETGASTVSLPGTFNGWDTGSTLTKNSTSGRFETTLYLAAGTHEFKVMTDGNWRGNAGTINNTTGDNGWYFDTNVGDNCKISATGGNYTFSYDDSANKLYVYYSAASGTPTDFWIDLNPADDSSNDDILYPEAKSGGYFFYLPSFVDVNALEFHVSEGKNLVIGGTATADGQVLTNLASSVNSSGLALSGDFGGTMYLKQSANIASVHTTTSIAVPQGTFKGYESKDDYETKGSIVVFDADGERKNSDTVLKKIKGRGNSSWQASHEKFGKYAFNITLDKKAKLLDQSDKSKKFCLVSYNADEARMRNMIIYGLSHQIGVEYAPGFEPVDFYNNGLYIGSYLLTDKVEIGDPLVDIVNLDEVNEEYGSTFDADGKVVEAGNNYNLYDDDDLMERASSNGSLSDTSTKNYYKYIANLEEPPASEYADSGFLLEFELNERFDEEISGFISSKGQQIVCKYPEFATKNEIKFIRDKWNAAEALMYDTTSTYEELDEVIDVESFAKMYLIQELSKNLDGGSTSYYVFYDGGKLHAGVTWDYDWALGQYIQSGDGNLSVDKQTSGIFKSDANKLLDNPEGWWINSREIYPSTGTLATQAALCQNSNFWSVVVAEWNEIFHSEVTKYADSTVSSVSELDGTIDQFYDLVMASTAMDEHKWGFIEKDLIASWGSKDTGDDHDDAVVWLNNWIYNRVTWMNKYLNIEGSKHTGIYDVDYTIQPPTITPDKDLYQVGETITLDIEDKTDGEYYYKVYKNGGMWQVITTKSFTVTADKSGTTEYTVYAVSETSDKVSAVSAAATVNVQGYALSIDMTAPETVIASKDIVIQATTKVEEEVTYKLYLTGESKELVDTNNTGIFTIPTTLADGGKSFHYSVEASVTVDGETYTDTKDAVINVTEYALILDVDAPESVEAGMIINVKASAEADTTVTYEFYTGDGTYLLSNTTGIYSKEVTVDDIGTVTYRVVAKTTVEGTEFTATSEIIAVTVTEVKESIEVKLCFKSADTLAYAPYISTEGAVDNLSSEKMTRGTFICKNATETASYYWYEAIVHVSKAAPQLEVTIVGSRYALEGYIHLNITESGTIYLALENINFTRGNELQNLTSWDETERNWTMSASNMIYDKDVDKANFASVAANINLRTVGDANNDGTVNVKDATIIQKHLAGIITLNTLSVEISDINCDGKVTVKDATAIMKKLVALL